MKKAVCIGLTMIICLFALSACTTLPAKSGGQTVDLYAEPQQVEATLPEKKQTQPGLYLTAKEAYTLWLKSPQTIHIIDCRTPEEYAFVGHAPMAVNIPRKFLEYTWDGEENKYKMTENPDFVAAIQRRFEPNETLLFLCRSGGRSAQSVNAVYDAGFKKVYNIIDGFEGDKVKDSASYYDGKRMRNGWKNAGLPWTYKLKPGQVHLSDK